MVRRSLVSIEINADRTIRTIDGYTKSIPRAARLSAREIARVYAMKYLEQMGRAKGIGGGKPRIERWTGRSFNILKKQITKPIQTGRGQYSVLVPGNLIALDQMDIHKVVLKKSRSITRWYNKKIGGSASTITVHPHPWIINANRNAKRFIEKNTRKEIRRTLRKQGR